MSSTSPINFAELKQLISQSKTRQALDSLAAQLFGTQHTAYQNELILISNNLKQLERAKRIDILNFQDYTTKANQINESLLSLINNLEAGKKLKPSKQIKLFPFWKIALLLAGLFMVVLGVIGGGVYYLLNQSDEGPQESDWVCPDFKEDARFKVLVLPFHDHLPDELPTAPHKSITSHLNAFCSSKNMDAQVSRLQNDGQVSALAEESETAPYIEKCSPDMVIWGRIGMNQKQLAVSTRFFITDPVKFERIAESQSSGMENTVLQSFHFDHHFSKATKHIEKIFQLIFDFRNENFAAVVESADQLPNMSSDTINSEANVLFAYMVAQSHEKLNNPKAAIEAYTKVLAINPTESLALNNRASLNMQKQQYGTALVDLSMLINLQKADYEVYEKRAKANEELGNLGAAKDDLKEAAEKCPESRKPQIKQNIRRIDLQIREIHVPPASPGGSLAPATSADQASTFNRIGDYQMAERTSADALHAQPNNQLATQELIKAKFQQNSGITITQLKQDPQLQNIDKATLQSFNNPIFETIIQNEETTRFRKLRANTTIKRIQ